MDTPGEESLGWNIHLHRILSNRSDPLAGSRFGRNEEATDRSGIPSQNLRVTDTERRPFFDIR